MAITIDDFSKIWASTSPLTPYEFSESNYKEGWNFIGGTPPSRQMWDFLQKNNDEKMQYLADNYLPLSGGTLTGAIKGNPFTLTADDGNGNEVSLVGNPNGDLTWNGHIIPTIDSLFTTVSFTVNGDIGANTWGDLIGTFTYPTGYTKIVGVLAIMPGSPSNMKIVGWEPYGNNGLRVRTHSVNALTGATARVDLMLAK